MMMISPSFAGIVKKPSALVKAETPLLRMATVAPVTKPLHMLGLGMSVGTPKEGITAEVVFVPSFAALDAMSPRRVRAPGRSGPAQPR